MLVLRIVLAAVGFAMRLLWLLPRYLRERRLAPTGTHDGTPYFVVEKTKKIKSKTYTEHWLAMPLRAPAPFRIHGKEPLDRWRRVALVKESGRQPVDYYLTSHHPLVGELLATSEALRAAVLAVLERAHELYCDGSRLWVETYNAPDANHRELLDALRKASAPLESAPAGGWRHSYVWKTIVVEAAIWAIAGYTLGAAIGIVGGGKESIHLELAAILLLGVLVALGLGAVFLAVVGVWLRGATRGYDMFLLHAFLLFLLLPAGLQLASDLNRELDGSPSIVRHGIAERCTVKQAKGGPVHRLIMKQHEWPVPDEVKVGKDICESVVGPTRVTFTIGAGFLGLRWYRRVETLSAVWEP